MSELDRLRIVIEGDNTSYLTSLKESDRQTRQSATTLEGSTSAASKAVVASQTKAAQAYSQTGAAATASATQQSGAVGQIARVQAQAGASAALAAASQSQLSKAYAQTGQAASASAAQQAAAAAKGGGMDLMGTARSAGPYVAMAAAALKVGDTIAEWATNTRKFRAELEAARHANDELSDSVRRMNADQLKELKRRDAPIQQRRAELDEKLKEAQDQLTRQRKLTLEANERVRADEKGVSVTEGLTESVVRDGEIIGGFKWLKNRFTKGQERTANKEQAQAFEKMKADAEAKVQGLRDAKQALENELKDLAFQQQSTSRENIDLARIPEHLRGGAKLKRMGAADADVKKTQDLATEEMATKFSADTDRSARSLRLQAQSLSATTEELKVMEAALDGVSGANLRMMQASAQAHKQDSLRLTVAQTNRELEQQIAVMGKSASFTQLYGLKLKGASDAQLAMTKALGQQLRGKELQEQFMTAPQRYIKSMNELNELLQAGALDQATYARAANDARKQLEGQHQALQAIQGAASGSAAALEKFNEYQDRIRVKPLPGVEDMRRVVEAQQFRQAGGVVQGQAGGLGVGGVLAQGPMAMERNPPMMGGNADSVAVLREIRDILQGMAQKRGVDVILGLGGL